MGLSEVSTVAEVEYSFLARYVLTAVLTAVGIAIAVGPEIRRAVARRRDERRDGSSASDLSTARAGAH